jgi:hypothetical protein
LKHILLIILTIVLNSCFNVDKKQNSFAEKSNQNDTLPKENVNQKANDSLIYLIVDDYPVTNEMLKDKTSNNSTYLKQVGEVYSLEKAWFTNDRLQQTLVFQLYTDYHKMETYHFMNTDIPKSIVEKMELSIAEGKFKNMFSSATIEQKNNSFDGFINLSEKIDEKYFKTQKGIKLGADKTELIKLYDTPDSTLTEQAFEVLKWTFAGDYNLTSDFASIETKDLKKKTVAKDSFGHIVTAYFKNNKLVAQIIENDIP